MIHRRLDRVLIAALVFSPGHGGARQQTPPVPAVMPAPRSLVMGTGTFVVADGMRLSREGSDSGIAEAAGFLRESLAPLRLRDEATADTPGITLAITPGDAAESYRIEITPAGITIRGADADGLFWGVQTLRQLLPPAFEDTAARAGRGWMVPLVTIEDAPRFRWRGVLLDVARHVLPVDEILRQVDLFSRYKLNVLHWHLTDDQGWRIAVDRYPRLTSVGAWRTEPDGSRYGGFYTREDIRRVVAFARSRHMMVVPEFDVPGHSAAAIAAYPWLGCTGDTIPVPARWGVHREILCAGKEEVFTFLDGVFDEMLPLFPSPWVHVGGDEVPKDRWIRCAACRQRIAAEGLADEAALQSWFMRRVGGILERHGKRMIGWDEILEGDGRLPDGAIVQAWRGPERTAAAARAGYAVIASPASQVYLNQSPADLPLAQVYTFEPIPAGWPAETRGQVLGGEATLWSEEIDAANLDAMAYPRLLAFAERMWSPADRPYDEFVTRLDRDQIPRLAALGVTSGPRDRALVTLTPVYDATTRRVRVNAVRGMPEIAVATDPSPIPDSGTVQVHVSLRGRRLPTGRGFTLEPHRAWGRPVRVATPPSKQYPGTGPYTLTDHALGSTDHHDGWWQGWQGVDLDATIDLGADQPIRRVEGSFLQHLESWIVLPKRVEVWVSLDGKTWRAMESVAPDAERDPDANAVRRIGVRFPAPVAARWVRLVAVNGGPLPPEHPGAGRPSWLFADEILVRE